MATTTDKHATPRSVAEPHPQVLKARSGIAVTLQKGQLIQIYGSQVVDTWAFELADPSVHMSMEHVRASLRKLTIAPGDTLVSNHRTPIVTVIEDTSPGVHDNLIAACDRYRYEQLGAIGYHPSCVDNFYAAMKQAGVAVDSVPAPLNLFMNIPVAADGSLRFESPVATAEQSITLRAESRILVCMSACPQDMVPINGAGCTDVPFVVR